MTTIAINGTVQKMTRAEAMEYAINHLTDAPTDVLETLNKIRDSFTKKTKPNGPTKAEIANRELAVALGKWVQDHFDAEDPTAINARVIADNVPGIMTTQKVPAVVKYADNVRREKINGRVFYVPSDVEIVSE